MEHSVQHLLIVGMKLVMDISQHVEYFSGRLCTLIQDIYIAQSVIATDTDNQIAMCRKSSELLRDIGSDMAIHSPQDAFPPCRQARLHLLDDIRSTGDIRRIIENRIPQENDTLQCLASFLRS